MKYRAEIDGLRAVAVLPVILFHAGFVMRAVTEYAFELKTQTLCWGAGWRVEAVTFLLVSAIA